MTNQTHLLRHLGVASPDQGAAPRTQNFVSRGLSPRRTFVLQKIKTFTQLSLPD